MTSNRGNRGLSSSSDNGNTDLPTVTHALSLNNTDSNDSFLSSGTLYGEVNIPFNKFLSAKNSIEIHKNKVISNNQSLPNVSDRGHSLNMLINHNGNFGTGGIPAVLHSVFTPGPQTTRPKRAFEDYDTHDKTFIGQKPPKTVNWAPAPAIVSSFPPATSTPGSPNPNPNQNPNPKEDIGSNIKMSSRQASATKILITHRTSNLGLGAKPNQISTHSSIISDSSSFSVSTEDGGGGGVGARVGVDNYLQNQRQNNKQNTEECTRNMDMDLYPYPCSGTEAMSILEADPSKLMSMDFGSNKQVMAHTIIQNIDEHHDYGLDEKERGGVIKNGSERDDQEMTKESMSPNLTLQFTSPLSKDMGKVPSQTQSHSSFYVTSLPSIENDGLVSSPSNTKTPLQGFVQLKGISPTADSDSSPLPENPLPRRNHVFYHNNVTIQSAVGHCPGHFDVGLNPYSLDHTRHPLELGNRFSNTDLSYYHRRTDIGRMDNNGPFNVNAAVGVGGGNLTHHNYGGSAYNTGGCPSPLLHQTSISDYTLMSQTSNHEDVNNYKSSCLFLPAENYSVYNAQVNLTNTGEIFHPSNIHMPTHQLNVTHRDQEVESDDINTPPKVDNHNYDTDEDVGDPGDQTSILTMVNPRDLPAPDYDFVSRLVPVELHGLITRKCKKDCRVWLWKSKSRRQEFLDKQKQELKFSERDRDQEQQQLEKRSLTDTINTKKCTQQQHAAS